MMWFIILKNTYKIVIYETKKLLKKKDFFFIDICPAYIKKVK